MPAETKKIIEQFTQKSPTLCLSTCSPEGQAQSSLIYFAVDENLTLYFFSKEDTRKCENIAKNPKVALLMQDPEEQMSLQMEGVAQKITEQKELHSVFDFLIQTLSRSIDWPPPAGKIEGGDLAIYKVKLTWARLGHFKDHDRDIFTQLLP